MRTWHQVINH